MLQQSFLNSPFLFWAMKARVLTPSQFFVLLRALMFASGFLNFQDPVGLAGFKLADLKFGHVFMSLLSAMTGCRSDGRL